MSQSDFGNLSSPLSGTSFFNTYLEPWRDAVHSGHSGTSRPAYAVAGMFWTNTTTTPWVVYMFDGTDDIKWGEFNTTTNVFTPSGVPSQYAGSAGGTANALTLTPTIPLTAYAAGAGYDFLVTATNTAEDPTLNVSGLGTKTIKASIGVGKVSLPIGALQAGMIVRAIYDGTDFVVLNLRAYNPATAKASAGTVNLDTATGDYVEITGTTTITAITLANGQERTCRFSGILTLTNGASLILPTGANIATAAGDVAVFRGEPSGVVRCVSFLRANGRALAGVPLELQVLRTRKTDTFSTTSTTFVDVTGLSQAITLSNSANKVRGSFTINMGASVGNFVMCRLMRDSTPIEVGDAAGSRLQATGLMGLMDNEGMMNYHLEFEDAPGDTSAHTYKVQILTSGGTGYVNRTVTDTNSAAYGRTVSQVTTREFTQ